MQNGFSTTLSILNRTMEVIISSKGLAFGILSREDKRGKVYHTRDGRRHTEYTKAKLHAQGLIEKAATKRQIASGKRKYKKRLG